MAKLIAILLTAVFCLCTNWLVADERSGSDAIHSYSVPGCAEMACFSLLQLAGKEVPLDAITERFRNIDPDFESRRVSIKSLRNALSSFGLSTRAVHFPNKRIRDVPLPAVAFFLPGRWTRETGAQVGHFLTLAQHVQPDSVAAFEWTAVAWTPALNIPAEEIDRAWDGDAIVIDSGWPPPVLAMCGMLAAALMLFTFRNRPTKSQSASVALALSVLVGCGRTDSAATSKQCPIEFAQPVKALGMVDPSDQVEVRFPFKVTAASGVKITELVKSCACFDVNSELIGQTLTDGSDGELLVKFRPAGTPAQATAYTVTVTTDPPAAKPIIAVVSYRAARPPQVSVGELAVDANRNSVIRTQFSIIHHRGQFDPPVKLDVKNCQWGEFVFLGTDLKTEEHLVLEDPGRKLLIDTTVVRLQSPARPDYGEVRSNFVLRFSDRSTQTIPAQVNVRHPVRLPVSRVFCGTLGPGQPWSMKAPYRTVGAPIAIKRIVCDLPGMSAESTALAIQLSGIAPIDSGRFEGSVSIEFSDDALPALRLPVSGIVKEK